nr:hypothetical protein [Cowpea mild mottle virus]
MNELISKLADKNYIRLGSKFGKPIVINCVPGAGKTTLIRELLAEHSCFAAFSTVRADQENLVGIANLVSIIQVGLKISYATAFILRGVTEVIPLKFKTLEPRKEYKESLCIFRPNC